MKPIILAILSAVALCGCNPKESAAFEVTYAKPSTTYFVRYFFWNGEKNGNGDCIVTLQGTNTTAETIADLKYHIQVSTVPFMGGPTNSNVLINWFTEIKQ